MHEEQANEWGVLPSIWEAIPDDEKVRLKHNAHQRASRKRHLAKSRENSRKAKAQNPEKTRLEKARWRRENKDKIRAYRRKWDSENREKCAAYYRKGSIKFRSIARARRSPEEIFKLVMNAIPRELPRHERDDLVGTMCLAILEGKLLVKSVKAEVGKYLKAHNREYDTFKTMSLDEFVPGTKTRYVDNIASDAVHF